MMDLFEDDGPSGGSGEGPSNRPEFSVSEISGAVKRTLEGEFGNIRVRGEVGRVVLARTGHLYFDLKDDRNVLAAVSWKGQVAKLAHRPEEGMEIIATGRLTTFGPQSKYQLTVEAVEPAGAGALMAMLEKRRQKLAEEGLFDPARKKAIPFLPRVIGVVTSLQGAVIRDILHRLRDRFPSKVLIWPVAVQGASCAAEVARAIDGFNRMTPGGALPRPDLLIVARGGGSIEDLWGFNEEIVVRAAAASRIPLISAVGHETDTTLIDHAADRRAPTPTAAAEMAVPVRIELTARVSEQGARLDRALSQMLERSGQRLRDLSRAMPRADRLTETARQRLDRADERLDTALKLIVHNRKLRLSDVAGALRPGALARRLSDQKQRLDGTAARLTPASQRLIEMQSQRLARASDRLVPLMARQIADQAARLERTALRLDPAMQRLVALRREQFAARASGLRPAILQREMPAARRDLGRVLARFVLAAEGQNARKRSKLEALERLRLSVGYVETLKRGYAVVRGDGALVTRRDQAASASRIEIEFQDGVLELNGKAKG